VSSKSEAGAGAIALRAVLYAGLLLLLTLYAPDEAPRFIYLGF
jgi:hypothetical protein